MLNLTNLLIVTLLTSTAFAQSKVEKALKSADIEASMNVDFSILKGVDAGFRYTYKVEPSFQSGLYTRVDRWSPQAKFQIPKVMIEIEPNAEVIFLRQFPTQVQAIKARPKFSFKSIPLTAGNALSLDAGEVVMMPVSLNLMVGPNLNRAATGPLEIGARAQYVMRGSYQIQVLRLADSRVRLRLIATRKKGLESEAQAKLSLDVFELTGLNKVTNAIFGTRLGSFGFGKGPTGLVMADYVFDLSNSAARDAYNHLLSSDKLLTNFTLVNPVVGKEQLQRMFVADLATVDQIAAHDAKLPFDQRRIIQIFKGRSKGVKETSTLEASLFKLITFRHSTSISEDNHVVFLDSDNDQTDFLAPNDVRERDFRLLFGLRSEQMIRKASIITPADGKGRPFKMGEFVVSLEIKDKHLGVNESRKVLENLNRNISPSIIRRLKIASLLTAREYDNARVYAQVIFNERAMNDLQGITTEKLVNAFNEHLMAVRTQLGDPNPAKWVGEQNGRITSLSLKLVEAFRKDLPMQDRIRQFMAAQRAPFFREFGTGVLMSLFKPQQLGQLLSVYIRVDATAFKAPVEATFGTSEFRSVVKVTEYIEHLLDKGAFDLRLETFGPTSASNGQVLSLSQLAR